ncbi:multidrug resistance protein, MATE family [Propionispira arboris]|uniref:Probable multidrug resistance protein NorM n=1 Tax=Propionispira arboris TaxID=84035 RepID=A0A1H6ZAG6_9FIRM|nr:MATE family efflux transporter [Propionispira arboris]SEJ50471.1 multidrug resistance protein, MATE family [Propionispira arboris]
MKQKQGKLSWADHQEFLNLALPLMILSLATPLLGVVDTAIMGRLDQASYIGGISIAVLIFNTLYWVLGFLRVSTSGFTAQARGMNKTEELTAAFFRPLMIAIVFGVLIIAFQYPIKYLALIIMSPSAVVEATASSYYDIRIWGAPFTLAGYVVTGWLLGMAKVRISMALQILMNIINMALSLYFVLTLQLAGQGVAYASLISEVVITLIGVGIVVRTKEFDCSFITKKMLFAKTEFLNMMCVNRDLFIRTICLLVVYNVVTYYGMQYGEIILAANAVIMQIHYMIAYFLGSFDNTTTVLVGRAIGKKDTCMYLKTVQLSVIWSTLTAAILSLIILFFPENIIAVFTNIVEVQQATGEYLYWMIIFPLVVYWGLVLYGFFLGATDSVPIRNSTVASLLFFFVVLFLTVPYIGNHGVWMAFIAFSLGRTIFLWPYLSKLTRRMLLIGDE